MELKYIKRRDLRDFRKKQYDIQGGVCPILKKRITFEDSCVDHFHSKKGDIIGENGIGEIRGVLSKKTNSFEGLVLKAYKRMGLMNEIELPYLLENLAQYLRYPPLYGVGLIHPNEKPREKKVKLGIRRYNRIKRHWKEIHPKKEMPDFSDKLFLTKVWQEDLDKAIKISNNLTNK